MFSWRLISSPTDLVVTDIYGQATVRGTLAVWCVCVCVCVWEEGWVCLSGVTEAGGVTPTAHQPWPSTDRSNYRNTHSPIKMLPVWPHSNSQTKRLYIYLQNRLNIHCAHYSSYKITRFSISVSVPLCSKSLSCIVIQNNWICKRLILKLHCVTPLVYS